MMNRTHDWLTPLVEQSLGNFELTPEIDADLSARAVAAHSDPLARNELFVLLAMKIRRFASRFRRWGLEPWEFDDVLQETYLAYVETLRSWRPLEGNGGPAGFGYYFVRVFPLRLSDHVNAMTRTRRGIQPPLPWQPDIDLRRDPGEMEMDIATDAMIAAICGRLNAADATIFRLRAAGSDPVSAIAIEAGISRRTLFRRWNQILTIVREELDLRRTG